MGPKLRNLRLGLAVFGFVLLLACPSPTSPPPPDGTNPPDGGTTPTTYSRIIIDTYDPSGTGIGLIDYAAEIELFSESGVSSSVDPWTGQDGDPAALASNGAIIYSGSHPAESGMTGWAYIDYAPPTPLASGAVLYVRVSGCKFSTAPDDIWTGAYAIRVMTSENSSYPDLTPYNIEDSPYEDDDPPTSGAVPTNAPLITVNGLPLNRYLDTTTDVDWVKIVLP